MPDPDLAVVARHVTVRRGDVVALEDVDVAIPRGRVTSLVGPNGSGKSTFLHLVAGLLEPDEGHMEVLGSDPDEARFRVAYVLQETKANPHLPVTAREVVAMGRYVGRGLTSRLTRTDRQRVEEAMEQLEVADLARRHLGELSGGQRQRVLVAQGIAQDADLLLLDEPVQGVDLTSRETVLRVMQDRREAGSSVIFSTHDLVEAARADHTVLMRRTVVAEGTPEEALSEGALAEAYGPRVLRLADGNILVDDPGHHHG